jgi:hypothetical protein
MLLFLVCGCGVSIGEIGDPSGNAGVTPTCKPVTCAAQGKNCGTIMDGCGDTLDCGTCTASGESCGGGGVANVCGTGSCVPTTCAAEGKDCGLINDGCSNMISCGTCAAPATCGGGGVENVCGGGAALPHFSFFLTSLRALRELSGNDNGFGGDLRFGETGPGAGLRGADKICAAIAERSMPGASAKQWRAFLSATADEDGNQVDAIDRIGDGPWYDRIGRLFAKKKRELLQVRPVNADPAIKNDFPNEDGVPNHDPDGTGDVDNHETLTGSNDQGRLYSATATCADWTTSDGSPANGRPRVGHSWPRGMDGVMANWISCWDEAGCAARVYLQEYPPVGPAGCDGVGCAGGYGGFYCFALTP